ncbi:hypothetical protein Hypma_009617 [Hypsizygus marmoreus]|uniref:CcmS related domain-containing protein n=1 Tax=Hypsizygus marmoreus TaxID=39966 RepID=A0A369JU27_HYPMA|nr:hypothetical protein Hypma_009617 [Hypsizygus marmoreus]
MPPKKSKGKGKQVEEKPVEKKEEKKKEPWPVTAPAPAPTPVPAPEPEPEPLPIPVPVKRQALVQEPEQVTVYDEGRNYTTADVTGVGHGHDISDSGAGDGWGDAGGSGTTSQSEWGGGGGGGGGGDGDGWGVEGGDGGDDGDNAEHDDDEDGWGQSQDSQTPDQEWASPSQQPPSAAPPPPPPATIQPTANASQPSPGQHWGTTQPHYPPAPTQPVRLTSASEMANRGAQPPPAKVERPGYYWPGPKGAQGGQSKQPTVPAATQAIPQTALTPWGQPKPIDPWGELKPQAAGWDQSSGKAQQLPVRQAWQDWGKPTHATRATPATHARGASVAYGTNKQPSRKAYVEEYDEDDDDDYSDDESDETYAATNPYGRAPHGQAGWGQQPKPQSKVTLNAGSVAGGGTKNVLSQQEQSQILKSLLNQLPQSQAGHSQYGQQKHAHQPQKQPHHALQHKQKQQQMHNQQYSQHHQDPGGKKPKNKHKEPHQQADGWGNDGWDAGDSGWGNTGGAEQGGWGTLGDGGASSSKGRDMPGGGKERGWGNENETGWGNENETGWGNENATGWGNENETGWGNEGGSAWGNNDDRGKGAHDNSWGAANDGWGDGDDRWGDEEDDYDDHWEDPRRQGHATPPKGKSKSPWDGSQTDTTYSMPSKTLTHAYNGTHKTIPTGVPPNKMNEYTNIQLLESRGAAFRPVQNAIFGKARKAKDRIHWMFSPNKDERVSSLLAWIQHMEYNLGSFGLHKFLQSRERGALFSNAAFRLDKYPNQPVFDWLTFDQLQLTRDRILQESLISCDPGMQVVVFVFLPSPSGNSVAMWRRKILVPNNTRLRFQQEIALAKAGLRKDKDYIVHVDELPPKEKGKTLRKDHTRAKSLPPIIDLTAKKKKRKWWQILRFED